jgi:hypothetical protein
MLKEPLTLALYQAGIAFTSAISRDDISNCYGGLLLLILLPLKIAQF